MVDPGNIKIPISIVDDAQAYSLSNWQLYFSKIFSDINKQVKEKGYSNNQIAFCRGYIISHITQDLGDLSDYIRVLKKEKVRIKIGSIFAWVSALANELNFELEKAIWEKYPGFCPYCSLSIDCIDGWWTKPQLEEGKDPTPKIKEGQTAHTQPQNLSGWITIWDLIYGNKYRIGMPLHDFMFKLFEESAEILEELDKDKIDFTKLQREVADFVSWLFALIIKLDSYGYLQRDDLPKYLFNKFGKGCPWCKKDICQKLPAWLNEKS